jgi:hypothetical protein
MDELGPDEQKWLDMLRAADEPSAADRARVRTAVLAGVASAGITSAAVAGVAKSAVVVKTASAASFFAATWKIGVAVVLLVVAAGATAAVMSRTPTANEAAPIGVTAPAAIAAAPIATTTTTTTSSTTSIPDPAKAAPAVTPEPVTADAPEPSVSPAVRAPLPSTAKSATTQRGDDVDAELVLMTQAQRALDRRDPSAALGVLARHGREYPHGAFAVEREGMRAIASCAAKRGDGRALAERFVAANPTSPLVSRVRATCLSP